MNFYEDIAHRLFVWNTKIDQTSFSDPFRFIEAKREMAPFKGKEFYENLLHALPNHFGAKVRPSFFEELANYCSSKIKEYSVSEIDEHTVQMQCFKDFITEVQTLEIRASGQPPFLDLNHYNQNIDEGGNSDYETKLNKLLQNVLTEILILNPDQIGRYLRLLEEIEARFLRFWGWYNENNKLFRKGQLNDADLEIGLSGFFNNISNYQQASISNEFMHSLQDAVMFKEAYLKNLMRQVKKALKGDTTSQERAITLIQYGITFINNQFNKQIKPIAVMPKGLPPGKIYGGDDLVIIYKAYNYFIKTDNDIFNVNIFIKGVQDYLLQNKNLDNLKAVLGNVYNIANENTALWNDHLSYIEQKEETKIKYPVEFDILKIRITDSDIDVLPKENILTNEFIPYSNQQFAEISNAVYEFLSDVVFNNQEKQTKQKSEWETDGPESTEISLAPLLSKNEKPRTKWSASKTLKEIFVSEEAYNNIMKLLVAESLVEAKSFRWIDRTTGYKSRICALLYDLYYKKYYDLDELPSPEIFIPIAKSTFGVTISKRTFNGNNISKLRKQYSFIKAFNPA